MGTLSSLRLRVFPNPWGGDCSPTSQIRTTDGKREVARVPEKEVLSWILVEGSHVTWTHLCHQIVGHDEYHVFKKLVTQLELYQTDMTYRSLGDTLCPKKYIHGQRKTSLNYLVLGLLKDQ